MTEPDAPLPDLPTIESAILRGGGRVVRGMFEAQGSRAPSIQWSPHLGDLNDQKIVAFASFCQAISGHGNPILDRDFDIEALREFERWLMVLEVENDGTEFRYSHFGNGIANVRGISMLGQTSAALGGHIGLFFTAAYRAILVRPKWLMTVHEPPKEIFARSWERLIVPITDDAGAVCRFVAMNVPTNELRAGLEIIPDPVMVLDAQQIVRYANKAARRVFDRQEYQSTDLSLFEYTGIDLNIDQPPDTLVKSHAVHDKVCLAMRNSLLQDFLVTISGAKFRGNAFYVITLRMDIRTG